MIKRLCFFLFVPAMLFGAHLWQKTDGPFSAKVMISPASLSVLDTVSVELQLAYPTGSKPDLDRIRSNLVDYAGFTDSPFTILSERVEETAGNTRIRFDLNPQIGGAHAVTPRDIRFYSQEGGLLKTFISNIFIIEATVPGENLSYQGEPAPLVSLSSPNPIEISQTNLDRWINNENTIKASAKEALYVIQAQAKQFETLVYGFIFLLLTGFIVLIKSSQNNRNLV